MVRTLETAVRPFFASGICVLLISSVSKCATDELEQGIEASLTIDNLVLAWQQQRDRVRTIEYTCQGTAVVPRGTLTEDVLAEEPDEQGVWPPNDYRYPTRFKWMIDFENGWFRKETERQTFYLSKRIFIPRVKVAVFDGSASHRIEPRNENTNEHFTPRAGNADVYLNLRDFVTTYDLPVLFAHGYIFPIGRSWPDGNFLRIPLSSEWFTLVETINRDGRAFAVVRTVPETPADAFAVEEFVVDLERDYQIVEWTRTVQGVVTDSAATELEHSATGWLPKQITIRNHSTVDPGAVLEEVVLRVTDVRVDFATSKEQFQISPKPGMIVTDVETGETFTISRFGPGAWLVVVIAMVCISLMLVLYSASRRRRKHA